MVKQLATKAEWDEMLKTAGEKLVAVDFTATWCGPCQRIGPKFVELSNADDFKNVIFIKVDVDENEEVASMCGIKAMPTFQFYKSGTKIEEFSGADPAKLEEKLRALM